MKPLFLLLSVLGFSFAAHTQECSIPRIQVASIGVEKSGTGIAVTSNLIMVNEHTLSSTPMMVSIEEKPGSSQRLGKVVARDFHTDLALIEISGSPLVPCMLTERIQLKQLQPIVIQGRDKDSQSHTKIMGRLMDLASGKLLVPGVPKSLEIQNSDALPLPVRESLSGSAILHDGVVVGMVSQKTVEGSVLAIPVALMKTFLNQYLSQELPTRAYTYNSEKNTFSFFGLTMSALDQSAESQDAGNPHNGRTNFPPTLKEIYGKANSTAISSAEQNSSVLAHIRDLSQLAHSQPDLARVIRATGTKVILIRSVEGIKTPNVLSLLRVLGSCNSCNIDQFLISPKDRTKKMDSSMESLVGAISQLRLSIIATKETYEILQTLDILNQQVLGLLKDERIFQAQNPKNLDALKKTWRLSLDQLVSLTLTEDQDQFISEIMERIP